MTTTKKKLCPCSQFCITRKLITGGSTRKLNWVQKVGFPVYTNKSDPIVLTSPIKSVSAIIVTAELSPLARKRMEKSAEPADRRCLLPPGASIESRVRSRPNRHAHRDFPDNDI
ncbi:hypothetical protein ACJJTC_010000 [Scirpophaga incertulas]